MCLYGTELIHHRCGHVVACQWRYVNCLVAGCRNHRYGGRMLVSDRPCVLRHCPWFGRC